MQESGKILCRNTPGTKILCLYQNRNSRSQKQNHPGARRVSYLALKNQASSRRTKRYSGKYSEGKKKIACNDNENSRWRKSNCPGARIGNWRWSDGDEFILTFWIWAKVQEEGSLRRRRKSRFSKKDLKQILAGGKDIAQERESGTVRWR